MIAHTTGMNHLKDLYLFLLLLWLFDPIPGHSLSLRCFAITLRHTSHSMTSLDEWSARRRDLYLTTHNTHNRQTSMPLTGFEPAITARERQQIHAIYGAATGIWSVPLLPLHALIIFYSKNFKFCTAVSEEMLAPCFCVCFYCWYWIFQFVDADFWSQNRLRVQRDLKSSSVVAC